MSAPRHDLIHAWREDDTGKWGWTCSCGTESKAQFYALWTAESAQQMHANSQEADELRKQVRG